MGAPNEQNRETQGEIYNKWGRVDGNKSIYCGFKMIKNKRQEKMGQEERKKPSSHLNDS